MGRRPEVKFHDDEQYRLSESDVEILTLAAKGFRAFEVADMVHKQLGTIKNQYSAILVKLQATTKCEAVYRALKEGLIE